MQVIRLTEEHFNQCAEMIGLTKRVSGTVPIDRDLVVEASKKYFVSSPLNNAHYAFGTVEDGVINSWMSIFFRENKTRGRYWALVSFYTKNLKGYFSFNNSDYQLLLRHCIDFAEQQGYYQFYYSVSSRINNVFSKKWKENELSKVENYNLYDLVTIPAFTKSDSELYWGLMGGEVRPNDIVIKFRVRKDVDKT